MTKESALAIVQGIAELKEVPISDLQWLVDNSELSIIPKGEHLFAPKMAADRLLIVLEGAFRIYALQNG